MDAVACAAPAASLLSRSFADAAIARALSFSVSGCSPDPDHQSIFACSTAAATPAPALICEPPSARCRQQQLGPAGAGRAGKRRPRPSKRAPTTYISTDAATFRLMVQHVTGADADTLQISSQDAGDGLQVMPPHFDVVGSSLLPSSVDPAAAYVLPPAPAAAAAAAADQPCFPTLDSWNVMYGKNEAI